MKALKKRMNMENKEKKKKEETDKKKEKTSTIDRSILPTERLLSDLDLTLEDIDEIVMVGGTTRMPQIRILVRQTLPTAAVNTRIDPYITVAFGAASVRTPHSFETTVVLLVSRDYPKLVQDIILYASQYFSGRVIISF
jgi:molecular chaperone DnaK (HSP70)